MATDVQQDERLDPEFLTPAEVAHTLRLSTAAVYRAVDAGRLPCVRLSDVGAIRIPAAAITARGEPDE